jgi:hypothetical protein
MQQGPQSRVEFRPMTERDLTALRSAVAALEYPSLAARLGNMAGRPIELLGSALPAAAAQAISAATSKALEIALQVALRTMQGSRPSLSQRFHKILATASGAAGGALGWASLPIELPVSTVIMLRSIAEIARSEGEDLSDPEAALSCMQVFALGGRAGSVDASESGYFAVRAVLAKSVSQAARFVIERGAVEEGAPVLVRFIAQVASRFGLVVSQKVAAQAVPLLGGFGGAAVNYAFIEHFQDMARAHFTVRRLERVYGAEIVRQEYERFAQSP